MPSLEFVVTAFLAIMLLASLISHKTRLPYTLVLVLVGVALSSTSLSFFIPGPFQKQVQDAVLGIRAIYAQLIAGSEGGLFVGLIVPPLIFEAMMHVRSSDLKEVIRPSLLLATVGVVAATIVGGMVLWKVAGLPFNVSFLFAALISPTDAATVLAIFRRAKVPSKLAALMNTEAALNDATAIVIFTVILASLGLPEISFVNATEKFALTFGGGVVIGVVGAFAGEILTSLISDRLAETILTVAAVYGSYTLATSLGFSGLIAVSIVGIYFGHYTIRTAMGPASRESVELFWEIAAFVGNSVAFLFIGFQTDFFVLVQSIGLIIIAYLAVTIARAVSVYPTLTIFDRLGKKFSLPWRNVAMLGGMRGALSVALAASIPVSIVISVSEKETISTMVLGVAFLSISLQAALLLRYIRRSFREEHAEQLNVRLSKAMNAIEDLQKLADEDKLSPEAFVAELEKEKDELREVLGEVRSDMGTTTDIMKARAYGLYSSIVTLPMSRAMDVLRSFRMEKPIERIVQKASESEKDKSQ
jgi:CPA1 family monovalent cation:H+ antiporter